MGNSRPRPKLLPEKLLAIREFLNVGQVDMASELQSQLLSHCGRQSQIQPARISEYENGEREPNLFVLIAYICLGRVHMESLVDDGISGDNFHRLLGRRVFFSDSLTNSERQKRANPVTLITGAR